MREKQIHYYYYSGLDFNVRHARVVTVVKLKSIK